MKRRRNPICDEVSYHLVNLAHVLLAKFDMGQCPRPLLTTKQTLAGMPSGHILKVIATDTSTKSSFPPYLTRSGDELLKIEESGEEILIFIKKK